MQQVLAKVTGQRTYLRTQRPDRDPSWTKRQGMDRRSIIQLWEGTKKKHARRDSNPQPPDSKSDALPLRHGRVAVRYQVCITHHNCCVRQKNFAVCAHCYCSTFSTRPLALPSHATAGPALLDLHVLIRGALGTSSLAAGVSSLQSSALVGGSAISISPLISQRQSSHIYFASRHWKSNTRDCLSLNAL